MASVRQMFQAANAREDESEIHGDFDEVAVVVETPTAEAPIEAVAPAQETAPVEVAPAAEESRPDAKAYTPVILGRDANLFRVNAETGAIEPLDENALAYIEQLGESLDAFVMTPGTHSASQVRWDAEEKRVSVGGGPRLRLARPEQINLSSLRIVPPATTRDRLERIQKNSAAGPGEGPADPQSSPKADKTAEGKPTAEDLAAHLNGTQEIPEPQKPPQQTTRGDLLAQYGPGGAVAMGLIGGLVDGTLRLGSGLVDGSLKAVEGSSKLAGRLVADGIKGSVKTCQEVIDQLRARSDRLNQTVSGATDKIAGLNRETSRKLSDLDGPGEIPSVATNLAGTQDLASRIRSLSEQDTKSSSWLDSFQAAFSKALNTNLEVIDRVMAVENPGNLTVEGFEQKVSELPQEGREAVEKSLQGIKENCQKFRAGIESWMTDQRQDKFSSLSADEQEKQAKKVEEWVNDPTLLADKKYKNTLENLGTGGETFREQMTGYFGGLSDLVSSVLNRVKEILGMQQHAVEVHEQAESGPRLG